MKPFSLMFQGPKGRLVAILLAVLAIAATVLLQRLLLPEKPGLLRIGAPFTEIVASSLSPYGPGYETELVEYFCEKYHCEPVWNYIDSWSEGWLALQEGDIDLLIGAGLAPPEDPGVLGVRRGPSYGGSNVVILQEVNRFEPGSPESLCEKTALSQNIEALPGVVEEWVEPFGCDPEVERIRAISLPPLLALVRDHAVRFAVADSRLFDLWQPFYPAVRSVELLPTKITRHWYWREGDDRLATRIDSFWERSGRDFSANLAVKYFGFFPRELDPYELAHLKRVVLGDLPQYRDQVVRAAMENSLDPLFLAAVIYQESRFDPQAVSRTGVRGLMQISRATAERLDLDDRTDPMESISAGARYLRMLHDQLADKRLSPWDRWFVTLAAYNQGLGHARDAMALAVKLEGKEGRRWRNIKDSFVLLSRKAYYSKARHGYVRGWEAADYVERIRYYYYVLSGLSVLPGLEAQELAPLAGAVPIGWPVH